MTQEQLGYCVEVYYGELDLNGLKWLGAEGLRALLRHNPRTHSYAVGRFGYPKAIVGTPRERFSVWHQLANGQRYKYIVELNTQTDDLIHLVASCTCECYKRNDREGRALRLCKHILLCYALLSPYHAMQVKDLLRALGKLPVKGGEQ